MTKSILWIVVVLLGSSIALAQPAPAPVPPNPADKVYQEGRAHYDLREWDQAIAKFKEAYKLRPDAASLFNIAQSYRLKGDCVEAANYYKTFKRNFPTEKNIAQVEKFIVDMEECAKSRTAPPLTPMNPDGSSPAITDPKPEPTTVDPTKPDPTKVDPTTPDPVRQPPPPPPAGSPGRGLRIGGLVVGGVGVACVVGGVFSGLSAKSKADKLEGLDVWDPALDADGKRADRRAKLLLGVGAGAIVTGGVLYFLGYRQGERAQTVSVVPHADGGMVVWSGRL